MKIKRYRGKAFRVFIPEGFNVLEDNIYDEIRQRFFYTVRSQRPDQHWYVDLDKKHKWGDSIKNMFLSKCFEDRVFPRDIALSDGEYVCKLCGTYLERTMTFDYKDYSNYRIRKYKPYDPKNHASHVLNLLACR